MTRCLKSESYYRKHTVKKEEYIGYEIERKLLQSKLFDAERKFF